VRQAEEQYVTGFQFGCAYKFVFADLAQVGMHAGDRLAGMAFRGDLVDFNLGMEQQDA
jgi:hypothetical protein